MIAKTHADIRDTCFEGESGIVAVLKRYGIFTDKDYNRSHYSYQLPNGSRIKGFSAEEPDRLRGPQHHGGWLDELAAWKSADAYDQYKFGLRLGTHPQTVITTTPRPTKIIRDLMSQESTHITRGSTFENAANLAPNALLELQARYAGTRLGKQELFGEILDDVEGALWTRGLIDRSRLDKAPALAKVVVSIDPAVTNNQDSDETGIIVCGSDAQGHGYVLGDYSFRGTPLEWAQRAVSVFDEHKADTILVEVNQGGDMVAQVLRQVRTTLPIREVRAHIGKKLRAEPISAMYEQGRIHHIGEFATLEEQMTTWTTDEPKSPDRLDAMVQGFADLLGQATAANYLNALANFCPRCGLPMPKQFTHCTKCGSAMLTPSQA